ncbi:MAG: flagellar biosynthesis protein FliR [Paracoccaceae bacterium]|nr:MAG: type III secretion protein [Alphaproteobacteria bacterium]GIX15468.1 MAG: flagellar biosynthesis protein FliR [Paracoccaceae bacterium]
MLPLGQLLGALEPLGGTAAGTLLAALAVFVRVGAVVALLPGFGEQTLALRLRLAAALALTAIVAPMVWPAELPDPADIPGLAGLLLAEAGAGLALGILMRLTIMALQLAGSIAAQSVAVAQIFGAGLTPDPMPAIGNLLVIGGIALAMAAGLHVKAALMIALSYGAVPFGTAPEAGQLAEWGVAHGAAAFGLAVALAAPYLLVSLLYNLALGAINRAMPQLMVAFVGAPFITGLALVLLMLALPGMLAVWQDALADRLADPWEMPR